MNDIDEQWVCNEQKQSINNNSRYALYWYSKRHSAN